MENRITELETKISYQDLLLEELNRQVTEQQRQIDQLILQHKKINEQFAAEGPSGLVDISLETPPPHY